MLLTKTLKIRITGNVAEYYKKNNIDFKYNDYNVLPIEYVNPHSHLIVDAKCDICGKEVKIQLRRYNQSISRGGYYTCSSKCGKGKRENTNIDKYGDKCLFTTQEFKEKTKQTNLSKWGADHFRSSEKWKKQKSKEEVLKRKITLFNKFLIDNPKVISQDENNFIIKCDIHGQTELPKTIYSNRKISKTEFCSKCNPVDKNISGKEILLFKLISEIYDGEIIQSYKVGKKEIDIFLPDLQLGFEFNGLYWHSEMFLEKDYHLKKTKLCRDNGIRLIHIFEDDFDYKNEIIKSIILNAINKSQKIYARNTEIKKLNDKQTVKKFLLENHLQGFVNCNINYGLYYNNELVSVMSFSKKRKILDKNTNDNEYELVRFCNKLNLSVVGGASKLFKKFLNDFKPNEIISYCDLSWGTGNLYRNLGFKLNSTTEPNYHYIINGIRESRIKYQKHKLVKNGGDNNLTESQIMNNMGYYRIYNSGNDKYLYNNEKNN